MSWQPGQRVRSEQDQRDWQQWRRDRKREAQRARRAQYPRIDYYPDDAADKLIRSMSGRFVGGDFSSVINRIVGEWAEVPPEQTKAGKG
ncbi:MAG: hypothetical protein HZC37_30680 [Burkholderiales bacterium]|nr:hypothetical protein [Burkholderiales bacterium]